MNGTLTIDANLSLNNITLLMQPNSRIIMRSQNLVLDNSKIIGCGGFWHGIGVGSQDAQYLELKNSSIISGAQNAFYQLLDNNGNVYNGLKTMKVNSNSKLSENNHGIHLNKNLNLTVDNAIFEGGILFGSIPATDAIVLTDLENSAISITHSSFTGMSEEYITINGNTANINISNTTIVEPVNLSLANGIDIENMNGGSLNIQYNTIRGIGTAIVVNKQIGNCYIDHNQINAVSNNGIQVSSPRSGTFNILNNVLDTVGQGIALENYSNNLPMNVKLNNIKFCRQTGINCNLITNGSNTLLQYNTIELRPVAQSKGIAISSSSQLKVLENNVNIKNNNGLSLSNSNNCLLKWNTIIGVAENNGSEAIGLDMSLGNNFSCNTTNHTLRGFHSNNTCGNSFLYANQFRIHNTGLRIESGSLIGKQVHHWNTWLDESNYSNLGAENLNSDPILINGSEFTVATALNTAYHPSNSGNGMFKTDPIATPWVIKECLQIAPEDPERNSNLYIMTSAYSTNTPEEKTNGWESKRYVYRELKAHPEYMQQSGDLASFYTQQANSTLAAFYEVGKALAEDRYTDAAQLNAAISTTEVYESNLKAVYQLLSQTTTWTTTQAQSLLSIAQQCPAQGGSAVFLARDLYTSRVDRSANFDNINCNGVNNRASKENTLESSITIVPNPASDIVQLSNLPTAVTVKVEIYNTQGYLLDSKHFSTTSTSLDLNIQNYVSGIYFIRISNNNQLLTTRKLVIIK